MRTSLPCTKLHPRLILEVITISMLALFLCEVISGGMILVQNFAEKSKFCLKILFGIESVTRTRALPRMAP